MTDKILWRRITQNDMNAMEASAAPSGTGGGARHIAIGVDRNQLPIHSFLNVSGCGTKTLTIEPIGLLIGGKSIEFSCLASRRGGEWRITRQYNDRYPLWTSTYGFPANPLAYDSSNPPIIFIIRLSNRYHARFCMLSDLRTICSGIHQLITSTRLNSGILDYTFDMAGILGVNMPPPTAPSRSSSSSSSPLPTPTQTPTVITTTRAPPPQRVTSPVTRYIRDSTHGNELKILYNYSCIFCGESIERRYNHPYVESCHIKPLSDSGIDEKGNLLVLCPNHHIQLDYGSITIDPNTLELMHIDPSNPLHGTLISLSHDVHQDNLQYHFDKWTDRVLTGY